MVRETKHLAIALDKLQEKISAWVDSSSKKGKWSANTVGMTQGWLKEGLKPRMVTRDLSWGVPVPLKGWEGKVMYVWVSHFIAIYTLPSIVLNQLYNSSMHLSAIQV